MPYVFFSVLFLKSFSGLLNLLISEKNLKFLRLIFQNLIFKLRNGLDCLGMEGENKSTGQQESEILEILKVFSVL